MPDQHLVYLPIKQDHHQWVVTTEDILLNVIYMVFYSFSNFVTSIDIKINTRFLIPLIYVLRATAIDFVY